MPKRYYLVDGNSADWFRRTYNRRCEVIEVMPLGDLISIDIKGNETAEWPGLRPVKYGSALWKAIERKQNGKDN